MIRTAVCLAILGLVAFAAPSPAARADELPPAPPAPDRPTGPYAGPLQRAPSPRYFALRSPLPMRPGPSLAYAATPLAVSTTQPLQALGLVFDGDPKAFRAAPEELAVGQTWIKLKLPGGETGFVSLADLVTAQQVTSRVGSSKKVALLEAAVAAAKRTKGPDVPSGIYSQGGSCDAADATAAGFLPGKVLIWQEGSRLHFMTVLQPDAPILYEILNDHQVRELQGFGYVPMRTYRSNADAVLMGYKDRLLWVTTDGDRFNSYQACDPDVADKVVALLRSYADQRPPEAR